MGDMSQGGLRASLALVYVWPFHALSDLGASAANYVAPPTRKRASLTPNAALQCSTRCSVEGPASEAKSR